MNTETCYVARHDAFHWGLQHTAHPGPHFHVNISGAESNSKSVSPRQSLEQLRQRERGEEEERQTYPSCGTFPLVSGEKDESWNLSRRPWQASTDGLLDNLERDVEGVIRGEEAQQEEPGGRGNLLLHSLPVKRQTLGGWKSTMWSLPEFSNASWCLLLSQSEIEARSSRLNFASTLVFCHTCNDGSPSRGAVKGSAEACREWWQQGSLHVLVK